MRKREKGEGEAETERREGGWGWVREEQREGTFQGFTSDRPTLSRRTSFFASCAGQLLQEYRMDGLHVLWFSPGLHEICADRACMINARIKWFGRGSEGSGNRRIGSPYSRVRVEGRLRDICCQMPYAQKRSNHVYQWNLAVNLNFQLFAF